MNCFAGTGGGVMKTCYACEFIQPLQFLLQRIYDPTNTLLALIPHCNVTHQRVVCDKRERPAKHCYECLPDACVLYSTLHTDAVARHTSDSRTPAWTHTVPVSCWRSRFCGNRPTPAQRRNVFTTTFCNLCVKGALDDSTVVAQVTTVLHGNSTVYCPLAAGFQPY